jgi:energy-converting hydrogenase Eha subunit H
MLKKPHISVKFAAPPVHLHYGSFVAPGGSNVMGRLFNYMFFTSLYGVRNTGCPQISPKKSPN